VGPSRKKAVLTRVSGLGYGKSRKSERLLFQKKEAGVDPPAKLGQKKGEKKKGVKGGKVFLPFSLKGRGLQEKDQFFFREKKKMVFRG